MGIDVAASDSNPLTVADATYTQIPGGTEEVTHKKDNNGVHLTEIRSGMDGVRAGIGLIPINYTDSSITTGVTTVKAAHITDLRGGLQ